MERSTCLALSIFPSLVRFEWTLVRKAAESEDKKTSATSHPLMATDTILLPLSGLGRLGIFGPLGTAGRSIPLLARGSVVPTSSPSKSKASRSCFPVTTTEARLEGLDGLLDNGLLLLNLLLGLGLGIAVCETCLVSK